MHLKNTGAFPEKARKDRDRSKKKPGTNAARTSCQSLESQGTARKGVARKRKEREGQRSCCWKDEARLLQGITVTLFFPIRSQEGWTSHLNCTAR